MASTQHLHWAYESGPSDGEDRARALPRLTAEVAHLRAEVERLQEGGVVTSFSHRSSEGRAAPGNFDARSLAVRTQEAFVRALSDEIARYHEPDINVVELHDQLEEETSRLATMLGGEESTTRKP